MICFKCKKPDHIRVGCPILKKEELKKKQTMCVTWDELDTSDTENYFNDYEESLLCSLKLQDDVVNKNLDYDGSYDLDKNDLLSYEELSNAFSELRDDMILLCTKNIYLKEKIAGLTNEVKTFEIQESKSKIEKTKTKSHSRLQ